MEQKSFLRSFVKPIEVNLPQVVIDYAIPSETKDKKVEPLSRKVLPFAYSGSPSTLKDRTFRAVFGFYAVKKEPKSTSRKASRVYRNPVYLAQERQKALGNGDCSSPGDLARKLGVSRARVTQVLRILSLAPEILKAIAALGDPLPSPIVTERRLRPVVNLPPEEQRRRVEAILAGRENRPT